MSNEKIKEIKLSKQAKYGLGTLALVAIFGIGFASIATRGTNDEIIVDNQPVIEVPDTPQPDTPVVVIEDEKLAQPFTIDASIKTYYFDAKDTSDNQENALIYYNGMYTPSKGIDYFYNNLAFDVTAAFSGTITEKKVDPLYGATLYIKSNENNLVAVYSSLSDINVNVGDKVEQGQVIARAGNNTLNSNMGNHLNFSLLKDNKNINPLDYYTKVIKNI